MAEEILEWLGLQSSKIIETKKNISLCEKLSRIAASAIIQTDRKPATKQQGALLYHLGTRLKPQCDKYMTTVVHHIMNENIKNDVQLSAALDYLLAHSVSGFLENDFLNACGVGVTVAPEQVEKQVAQTIDKYRDQLLDERYAFNVGKILGDVKSELKWADGSTIKKEVDLRVMLLLGPKKSHELLPKKNQKVAKSKVEALANDIKSKLDFPLTSAHTDGVSTIEELMRKKTNFHKVGENFKTDGYMITPKTMELLKKHHEMVNGKVVTRFPPEPNGLLHIGHAKAINIDFGYAKAHGGICYLRFDDTNPEKEEKKFMDNIIEMVDWLGYKPYKITHSSDYFDTLYEWAIELIKKDLAYVCHQTVQEMRGFQANVSPWRDRPIAESLHLFEDMRRGKFDEGEATLRLKTVLEEGKMDPVAYRIKFCAHHRSGDKWCIYPTYDYTHCLCDSIENITHSLCTKEFQSRRSSYYWLCNSLDIYCPVQWEYGRLNVYYTVVSKRKIKALIDNKIVSNWDDPRLFTLTALRRRGLPAEAINCFIASLGLTTAQTFIDPKMLDSTVRDYLNNRAPRTMAVLEPIKVTIANFDELSLENSLSVPDFPAEVDRVERHNIAVDRVIYIEKSDYRQDNNDKKYRRLTDEQPVGLKHLGIVIGVMSSRKDEHGNVELVVKASKLSNVNKPNAFVHWVADPSVCEVRLYDRLFMHKNPEDTTVVPNGFLSDCNKDSLKIVSPVFIDKSIIMSKIYDRYQFERIGYFAVDPDSRLDKLIFNRTVGLKEDSGKN